VKNKNLEIIKIIEKTALKFPNLKLNQILHSLSIVSPEGNTSCDNPEDVLKRVEQTDLFREINKRDSFKGVF